LKKVRLDDSFSSWVQVLNSIPHKPYLCYSSNDIMYVFPEGSDLFVYAFDAKLSNNISGIKRKEECTHFANWFRQHG